MIPRQSSDNPYTNEMVRAIRDANTSSNSAVVTIKDAFSHLVKEGENLEKATYDVRDTSVMNTHQLIENIKANANRLSENMKFSMGEIALPANLVDVNYEMLRQSTMATKHLDILSRIQLGGKAGPIDMMVQQFKSIFPLTEERKRRVRARREFRMAMVVNKLMKLTYFEQKKTAEGVQGLLNPPKTGEEKSEEKSRWGKFMGLFEGKDKEGLTDREMKDLLNQGARLSDFIPLGLILTNLIPLTIGIVGSYLTRSGFIANIIRDSKVGAYLVGAFKNVFRGIFESKLISGITKAFKSLKAAKNFLATLTLITPEKLQFLLKPLIAGFNFVQKFAPAFKMVGKAFPMIGKFFKVAMKFFPILVRIAGQAGKFIPFVNVVIGVWEAVRGIFLGMKKIGGIQGAIAGLLGGVFEFFTLGIFDMDSYLTTVKEGMDKFKNGDILGGIWDLLRAPFTGIKDGLIWLGSKVFEWMGIGNGDFKIGKDAGLVGQLLYWSLYPYIKSVEFLKKAGDKLAGGIKSRVFGFLGIEESETAKTKSINNNFKNVEASGQDRATERVLKKLGITSDSVLGANLDTESGRKMVALALANAGGMTGSERAQFVRSAGLSRDGLYEGRNRVSRNYDLTYTNNRPINSPDDLMGPLSPSQWAAQQKTINDHIDQLTAETMRIAKAVGAMSGLERPGDSVPTIITTTTYSPTDPTMQREAGAGIR